MIIADHALDRYIERTGARVSRPQARAILMWLASIAAYDGRTRSGSERWRAAGSLVLVVERQGETPVCMTMMIEAPGARIGRAA